MHARQSIHISTNYVSICSIVLSVFHLEQKVRGGSFWKEELSNARGVWGHAPAEKFESVPGCGAWSLVVSDSVATSKFIGKLAARRGSLVVSWGGSFTPFLTTG